MKKALLAVIAIFALIVSLVAGLQAIKYAKAAGLKITVPDDYPTITAALGAASRGATIFVRNGTYEMSMLSIYKSVSIVGEDANTTIIKNTDAPPWKPNSQGSLPNVYAIKIMVDGVKISGFTFSSTYSGGIAILTKSDETEITNNVVEMTGGIIIEGNLNIIKQNAIKTSIQCNGSYNRITENAVNSSLGGKISLQGSFNNIAGNLAQSIVMDSAYSNTVSNNTCHFFKVGEYGHDSSHNIIYGNRIEGPNSGGVALGAGRNNVFHSNYIADFEADDMHSAVALGSAVGVARNNVFYHNNFVNNSKHAGYPWNTLGRGNSWDNGEEGNYWSGFNNTDSNYDGIGDMPYIIDENNTDRYPLMLPFNIEHGTVQLPQATSPPFFTVTKTADPSIYETPELVMLRNIAVPAGLAVGAILLSYIVIKRGKSKQTKIAD